VPNDTTAEVDLKNPSYYINRELSQIEFNNRVLNEAFSEEHPLLEQVKFLAITASNMDEFFMVRVSGLKQLVYLGITERPADGLLPREQLLAVHRAATALVEREMAAWHQLHTAMMDAGIHVLNYGELKKRKQDRLREYFEQEIFPVLTPLAFDPGHPFPHISNLSINLAVLIRDPDSGATHFARVKVPSTLPRLVPLKPLDPDDLLTPTVQKFAWVEEVIAANLDRLFPGMEIVAAHPFRVTRNTDMEIQEEEADDLLLTIEESLRRRHFGFVVRLEIDESMPEWLRETLVANLRITNFDVYTVDGPVGLSSLMQLHRLERPELKDPTFHSVVPPPLRSGESVFSIMRRQEILLHRPYDSFLPVIDLIEAAAADPDVLAIKTTLYRVGPNPPIVQALMRARQNGKQVTVLVELKARFDEESNIEWARALERAGVHVVYGLIGLKVHCKIALIIRREREGIQRYMHFSTGNYNAVTARIYTDLDFLTTDEALGADASEVFNFLTGYSKQRTYRKFLVAPVNMRECLLAAINRETEFGPDGRIIAKMNALVDEQMIRALYRASQRGVQIDLIVRGICCLRPGLGGISENIRVLSIVGRFLEHSRIYYFKNDGVPAIYVGSADMMPRNINRRVEVLFPIESPTIQAEILENVLKPQLRDTEKGYWLQSNGSYRPAAECVTDSEPLFNSQSWFLNGRTTLLQPLLPDIRD
jgi:polyphosphate kinase